jgi:N-acetylmuramoyl-L-alanine amidase
LLSKLLGVNKVRFHWFILTCLSFLFFANPAYAGKLVFWRFDSGQNRLTFNTDQGVQPTAQLIYNPTRVVIDLPGTTLGKPTVNQNLGNVIKSLRVGQFDSFTSRLVIELAPGYTLDPQQIRIRGVSPTQWTVDLPQPQRVTSSPPSSPPYNQPRTNNPNPTDLPTISSNTPTTSNPPPSNTSSAPGLKVTNSGFILDLDGTNRNKINTKRSRDGRKIDFELEGITLPDNLPRGWSVNQYGVKNIEISQKTSSVALLTFEVEKDSPDWQASFGRGMLILWPQGGIGRLESMGYGGNNSNPQVTKPAPNPTPSSSSTSNQGSSSQNKVRIDSLEVSNNQLVIRAKGKLQASGSFNPSSGFYELTLNKAELAPNFRNPLLPVNSPISRLRIWQPDSNTVVILAEPARGVSIDPLTQSNSNTVTVPFTLRYSGTNLPPRSSTVFPSPPPSNSVSPLDVTPPPQDTWQSPPSTSPRTTTPPSQNQSKVLVVIDPGHGGKDPGAIGVGGMQEKHVVMDISNEVARILEQQGVQVKLTRSNDYFISLEGRTQMANRINADIFVSIHANSAGANKPQVSGLETYYHQNGRQLADIIHRNILRRVDVRDRKVRQARFYVLRTAKMPSVLVETGFVTGSEDAAKLSNPSYRKQMAEAIAAGIVEYIRTNRL